MNEKEIEEASTAGVGAGEKVQEFSPAVSIAAALKEGDNLPLLVPVDYKTGIMTSFGESTVNVFYFVDDKKRPYYLVCTNRVFLSNFVELLNAAYCRVNKVGRYWNIRPIRYIEV